MSGLVASVALALQLSVGPAADPAVAPPAPAVEEVVVTGRRLRQGAAEYVRETAVPTTRGLLARWRTVICPGVIGLPETYGQYIADRIAEEAGALGLQVGAPGCRPNVTILITPEAEKAAREFVREHGDVLAAFPKRTDFAAGPKDQTIEEFIRTGKPVRWWHVAGLGTADGRPVELCKIPSQNLPPSAWPVAPCQRTTGSSRLSTHRAEELAFVLILVDGTRLNGASYEQLASYLTMPALAQLAADAEPGGLPSILTVFEDRASGASGEETLTRYDRAYLKALYAVPDGAPLRRQQAALRKALIEAGAAPPEPEQPR